MLVEFEVDFNSDLAGFTVFVTQGIMEWDRIDFLDVISGRKSRSNLSFLIRYLLRLICYLHSDLLQIMYQTISHRFHPTHP